VRPFKGIICSDISEFESHMPRQAVRSLGASSGLQKYGYVRSAKVSAKPVTERPCRAESYNSRSHCAWRGQSRFQSPVASKIACRRRFADWSALAGCGICIDARRVHTKSFLAVNVFPSCSTRSSPSVIWQTIKVNFAILLLREAAELVQASPKATSTRRPRYLRRPIERDE
jgi:hypothetical protein